MMNQQATASCLEAVACFSAINGIEHSQQTRYSLLYKFLLQIDTGKFQWNSLEILG